jgi:hypothetical protein
MMAIDVDLAMKAHTQAVQALVRYIDVGGARPAMTEARECPLGRWLAGDGQRFRHLPDFHRVVTLHERFHGAMSRIADLVATGRQTEAYAGLNPGSAFSRTSRELLIAYGDLFDAIVDHANRGD